MANTKIQWATKVWNPVTGCTPISEGCQNCYAKRMANRLRGRCGYPKDEPFRVTLRPERLEEPLRWKKSAMIFVNSMGDLFHENVPFEFVDRIFAMMALNPQHTFMILTKRTERLREYSKRIGLDDSPIIDVMQNIEMASWYKLAFRTIDGHFSDGKLNDISLLWPLPNIWLGVSVENQQAADERIPILLQIPAAVRFVSIEPMLGPVDLLKNGDILCRCKGCVSMAKQYPEKPGLQRIDWVVCGGETGPGARPMHPDWVRSLRDQCQAAGVPFFFKQWGEWVPVQRNNDSNYVYVGNGITVSAKKFASLDKQGRDVLDLPGLWDEGDVDVAFVGKKFTGDLLDGKQYHEFPEVTINGNL